MSGEIIESLKFIFTSMPYVWSVFGVVTATALFVAPALFNGKFKMLSNTVISLAIFTVMAGAFIFFLREQGFIVTEGWRPAVLLMLLFIFYSLGLFVGTVIHRYIYKKTCPECPDIDHD